MTFARVQRKSGNVRITVFGGMPQKRKVGWILRSLIVSTTALSIAIGWYSAVYGVETVLSSPGLFKRAGLGDGHAELLFLKAALERLDADARQTDPENPALRSLRAEQDAVTL